jgi:hypothetical protein
MPRDARFIRPVCSRHPISEGPPTQPALYEWSRGRKQVQRGKQNLETKWWGRFGGPWTLCAIAGVSGSTERQKTELDRTLNLLGRSTY